MDRQDRQSTAAAGEMPTIVVIDHDAVVRALLRAYLAAAGYEVFCAQDAIGGGHLVVEASPGLVICEAKLPYVSGYDFVSALRSDPLTRGIPVVLLTVKGEMPQDAERLGIVACLKKPVVPERVLAMVNRFVQPEAAASAAAPRTGVRKVQQPRQL